ncbi:MAG: GerMN domain-containing protein [Microcystaceae cyanobacterium]
MQNHRKQGRSSLGFIAGIVAAILVTGGGAAWWAYRSLIGSPVPEIVPSQPQVETPTSPQQKPVPLTEKAQVYWLPSEGTTTELTPSPIMAQKSAASDEVLETALTTLFAGPDDPNYTTSIPSGTTLLSVKTTQEGIYLDLSRQFTEGGGSASMVGRLKQLLYTATSINPNQSVWLKIEGESLELLGGEGLMVAQPMTRPWFEQEYGWEE